MIKEKIKFRISDCPELKKDIEKMQNSYQQEINKLQQELDQYKNDWEELKKYCEFQNNKLCKDPLKNQKSLSIVNWVLNKMKELEEGK